MTAPRDACRAYLGIGSNLGDRLAHLQAAVDGLAAPTGVAVVAVSPVYETAPVGGPAQADYLNAVVAVDTALDAPRRCSSSASGSRPRPTGCARSGGVRAPSTSTCCWSATSEVDEPDLVVPHPRMAERAFVLVPLADLDPRVGGSGSRPTRQSVRADRSSSCGCPSRPAPPPGAGTKRSTSVHERRRSGRSPWSGPGRAGTTLAARARRARVDAGRGRRPRARRARRRAAPRRGSAPSRVTVADAGRGADLVVVATPDAAIADAAAALAPGLEPGALVRAPLRRVHARRARQARAPRGPTSRSARSIRCSRCPSPELGVARLAGLVVRGRRPAGGRAPRGVARAAAVPGRRADRRAAYHAAATVASNHLVALLGQAARVADAAGVPPEALAPARARHRSRTSTRSAPATALTGPGRARRRRHRRPPPRRASRPTSSAAYRALAANALRLTGRDDAALVDARCAEDDAVITRHDDRRGPRRVRRRPRAGGTGRLRADDGVLPRRSPVADARGARRATTSSS